MQNTKVIAIVNQKAELEKLQQRFLFGVALSLEYTYQQILAIQAEQVNNKADLHDTNTKMAENMIESANILDFDKMIKKA